ncbi:MAG: hypothetical protein GY788_07445 [bacterium]|nr:hypothetical protein [bacterium]
MIDINVIDTNTNTIVERAHVCGLGIEEERSFQQKYCSTVVGGDRYSIRRVVTRAPDPEWFDDF